MNACLFVLCFALGPSEAPQPGDRFFGEDKWKHFFTSFVTTSLAASAARLSGLDSETSVLVGAGAALTLGVGKEVVDLRRPDARLEGSLKDFAWDLGGAGAAVLIGLRVQ